MGRAGRRVLWEFDDAVFMESACVWFLSHLRYKFLKIALNSYRGKEFMLEAIDVLKGVRIRFKRAQGSLLMICRNF